MSVQVHIVSHTTLFGGDGVGGWLLSLRGLWWHNPHTAGLLFCKLSLYPGLRVIPITQGPKVSFNLEIVGFLKVRKRGIRMKTRTVLLCRGTLGVQTGVHMVVEKHSFSPVDGRVQDCIGLQVLTVQVHSTRVCAVGKQGLKQGPEGWTSKADTRVDEKRLWETDL